MLSLPLTQVMWVEIKLQNFMNTMSCIIELQEVSFVGGYKSELHCACCVSCFLLACKTYSTFP